MWRDLARRAPSMRRGRAGTWGRGVPPHLFLRVTAWGNGGGEIGFSAGELRETIFYTLIGRECAPHRGDTPTRPPFVWQSTRHLMGTARAHKNRRTAFFNFARGYAFLFLERMRSREIARPQRLGGKALAKTEHAPAPSLTAAPIFYPPYKKNLFPVVFKRPATCWNLGRRGETATPRRMAVAFPRNRMGGVDVLNPFTYRQALRRRGGNGQGGGVRWHPGGEGVRNPRSAPPSIAPTHQAPNPQRVAMTRHSTQGRVSPAHMRVYCFIAVFGRVLFPFFSFIP